LMLLDAEKVGDNFGILIVEVYDRENWSRGDEKEIKPNIFRCHGTI
jgi:hypothetical protein